ncbi:hypothetical protein BC835DRAFT_1420706 [Cytidiella melzeri]|nr:hypothetical protein BC835DRAFT_1420706 [Cytidiella melzeri]
MFFLLYVHHSYDKVHHVAVTDIVLSIPTAEGKVDLSLSLDLEPVDFLEEIALKLNEDSATMTIGYKFSSDTGTPNRLKDDNDVRRLFERWTKYRQQPRSSPNGKVTIHLIKSKTEKQPEKAVAPGKAAKVLEKAAQAKATEEDCSTEFQLCLQHLACNCQGQNGNRWCWKDPKDPTVHILLTLEDMLNWAWAMKNDPDADRTCKVRPNSNGFDNKIKNEIRLQTSPKKAAPSINMPAVHVHISNPEPTLTVSSSKRKVDDELNTEDPLILLTDILQRLHERMPAANLPSYAEQFKAHGFYYAQNIVDSKDDLHLFTDLVGLPPGMVRTFVREVSAIVTQLGSAKRQRIEGKENTPPKPSVVIELEDDIDDMYA